MKYSLFAYEWVGNDMADVWLEDFQADNDDEAIAYMEGKRESVCKDYIDNNGFEGLDFVMLVLKNKKWADVKYIILWRKGDSAKDCEESQQ